MDSNDQLVSSADYRNIIIAYRNGAPVMLTDVAQVVDDVENARQAAWMNQTPAVILNVQRQPGANTINVVKSIKLLLPQLEANLPASIQVTTLTDLTTAIQASVNDVEFELMLTIGLVVLVIFLFLRSLYATIIPSVAVPLSIVGTFAAMYALGYSLDNLSLMALTVATGFVVDDAIVMIENVVRYIERGVPPLEAAFRGAAQIGFTIVSLTVSLIAVFIPLLFMTGVVGRLFKEFSVTLAVSVVVSAVVSLTLTPMMCGRLLRPAGGHAPGVIARVSERGFDRLLAGYRRTLDWSFRHHGFVLAVGALTLVGTLGLYVIVPKGFLPRQDTGVIMAVTEAAQSASIPKLAALQGRMAAIIRRDPAVTGVVAFAGAGTINTTPNTGRLTIALKPIGRRDPMGVVIARFRRDIAGIPGITAFFQPVQDIQIGSRVSRTQFQYTLIDTDAAELAVWAPRLKAELATLPELRDVASDQQDEGFRTYIRVDRDAAARLGVSMQAIEDTLYDGFGQRQISTIFGQANQYRVVLEADAGWQADPDSLRLLRVPGLNNVQVPLSA
ncbi:MAG TPA: efflux RND transporter permease subunit, partial [Rhodopila sp.]